MSILKRSSFMYRIDQCFLLHDGSLNIWIYTLLRDNIGMLGSCGYRGCAVVNVGYVIYDIGTDWSNETRQIWMKVIKTSAPT